ncbi:MULTISPECIES: hypothetical protein [Pseudofrankia]|uniref:hypothetical protein n=1 Tax=Pseudofrankia TaxID=2994363 RepID=UPI0003034E77|nr:MULTISPECIES: hypothetical protein [Pseudofrankia]
MIRRWFARRRVQRACPHPAAERWTWFTDSDGRSTVECRACHKTWVMRRPDRIPKEPPP